MAKKKNFQQALNRLEEITSVIEDPKTGLEDSLKLYKEAAGLFEFCSGSLDAIEAEITQLRRTATGEIAKEPFDGAEE